MAELLRTYVMGKNAREIRIACVCPFCGGYLDGDKHNFCNHCGRDLRAVDALNLSGVQSAVLFRNGVKNARILRVHIGVEQAEVRMDLKAAGDRGNSVFCPATDRFVLFRDGNGKLEMTGCPSKKSRGICSECDGRNCDDLVGWLGWRDGNDVIICGGLCRGNIESAWGG